MAIPLNFGVARPAVECGRSAKRTDGVVETETSAQDRYSVTRLENWVDRFARNDLLQFEAGWNQKTLTVITRDFGNFCFCTNSSG